MENKKKRIAVCFYGQVRFYEGLNSLYSKWNDLFENFKIDFFISTWDDMDKEKITLNFRKTRFFDHDKITKGWEIGNTRKMAYLFSNAVRLKQEYELENNFKYDVVVKTRPDVVFNPKRTFHIPRLDDGVIFTTHGGIMEMEFNMYNIRDIVFLGNSYTMDLLINLYAYRQYMLHKADKNIYNVHPLGPGTLMHEYMRDYGITPIFGMGFFETLLKEGCPENLDLFCEEDFAKMEKYFQEWDTK